MELVTTRSSKVPSRDGRRLLARNGRDRPDRGCPVSGVEPKSDFQGGRSVDDPIPEVAPTDELSLCAPDQEWLALLSASLLIAEVVQSMNIHGAGGNPP